MTLSRAVVSRITQLGGSGAEFDGVSFAGPLIFADWADYADEDVHAGLAADPSRARELVRYPALDWDVVRFTPFAPRTPDHDEWGETIDDTAVAAASGISAPTVVLFGYSDGWPNHFFVLAEDPNPADPAVYTTDHEVYFRVVEHRGTLRDLLNEVLTPDEFDESVRAALRAVD